MRIESVVLLAAAVAGPAAAQDVASEVYSLERALGTALVTSREIAEASAVLHGANGQVREAWASVLPEIRATASYQRNFRAQEVFLPAIIFDPNAGPDDLIPVRFGADNQWDAGIAVTQPLFQVNAFIGVSTAGRFKSLQTERLRGVAQNVVTTVRQAYFDVLLALENVRLTEQSVARVAQTLRETEALNRAGLASDYDVLRLDVQLGNLEPNLRRAQDGVAASTRALAVAMGVSPEQPIVVEGRLHDMNIEDPVANSAANRSVLRLAGWSPPRDAAFEEAYATALDERSDLRQVRLGIQLERARFAVARAEYFPKISLFANYNISAQENDPLNFYGANRTDPVTGAPRNERTTSVIGGLRVELPLFLGFARSARMQQAKANILQNEALLVRTQQQAASQLRTLLASLEETRQRVRAQQQSVGQARRGFEIASSEYGAGIGSQLQITDAEVALRQSEFNYAQAVYDYLTARNNLDAARGTVPVQADGADPFHTN